MAPTSTVCTASTTCPLWLTQKHIFIFFIEKGNVNMYQCFYSILQINKLYKYITYVFKLKMWMLTTKLVIWNGKWGISVLLLISVSSFIWFTRWSRLIPKDFYFIFIIQSFQLFMFKNLHLFVYIRCFHFFKYTIGTLS